MKTIYFDMDGTLANFYGVENWLQYLQNENPFPYANAKPLVRFSAFARKLAYLQKQGYKLGIVSWLSKASTATFDLAVTQAKLKWLHQHLPSIKWDEIKIVPYGTPKSQVVNNSGILFDDEERNLIEWSAQTNNTAYHAEIMMEILYKL